MPWSKPSWLVLIMDKTIMRSEGDDLFLYQGGKRIARRGRPGTREAGQWISIELEVREMRKGGESLVDVVYSRNDDCDSRGRLMTLWHSPASRHGRPTSGTAANDI
jgi:hypothetical protein